jgi:hypothetical protein
MIYELLPIESPKTAVISIARFGAMIRLPLTSNETPSGFSFSGTRLTELAESVSEKPILYTHDPRELCGWQVAPGLQEPVAQVIERLAEGENSVFMKSRTPTWFRQKNRSRLDRHHKEPCPWKRSRHIPTPMKTKTYFMRLFAPDRNNRKAENYRE